VLDARHLSEGRPPNVMLTCSRTHPRPALCRTTPGRIGGSDAEVIAERSHPARNADEHSFAATASGAKSGQAAGSQLALNGCEDAYLWTRNPRKTGVFLGPLPLGNIVVVLGVGGSNPLAHPTNRKADAVCGSGGSGAADAAE
jgi:hypothetical protein